jgi:acyl-CoA hydrolase
MAKLTPVRHGRMAEETNWQKAYGALRITADEAASQVRDGDVLTITGGSNWPEAFDAALARRLERTGDRIEIDSMFMLEPYQVMKPELREQVRYYSDFFACGERKFISQGNIDYCPVNLGETGRWMGQRHPRIGVINCSAPDENGWMSRSIWGGHVQRSVLESCELLIAEVNDQLPWFASDGEAQMLIHVSEVDGIFENSHPPLESPPAASDETDRKLADYIAEMIPDGGCVQFGLGGLANAIGSNLVYAGKKDLGLQSEIISNCVMDLMEKGVINNSRKAVYPGRSVGAYFAGDRKLWDFANHNPDFCHKEIEWVNNSRGIAQNDRVISINNAMEIDLTGQVNGESIGTRQFSGTGGQMEWVIGSQWSRGGKSIIALRSSYRDRQGVLHSKIHPTLPAGSVVTTPRTFVQYVVTEYGVANLKYKSLRQRAEALIAIAHPDFREELRRNLPF